MIKILVKLALAAVIANATWRLGYAYVQFYKFKDAVTEAATFDGQRSDSQLQQRVLELASQYDLPLEDARLTVRRDDRHHTLIDGAYDQSLEFLPGYRYSWPFSVHVDVLTLVGSLR